MDIVDLDPQYSRIVIRLRTNNLVPAYSFGPQSAHQQDVIQMWIKRDLL